MLHESIKLNEFMAKEESGFRLRVKHWKCAGPVDLNSLEFTQECIDVDGEVSFSSTYNFFLTNDEIKSLCDGLLTIK
jgi:hypothetical protein